MQGKALILLLGALLCLCSQTGNAQFDGFLVPPSENAEAIHHLRETIRVVVDAEANPGPGASPVNPEAVWRAHEALFRENLKLTVETLREILTSEDHKARALSVRLLGHIPGWKVRQSLVYSAEGDPAPRVRLAALDALRTASAFPEVCGVLREYVWRHDDLKQEEFSYFREIRKAQELLESSSVVAPDSPPDLSPPTVSQGGVVGPMEAEQVVTEVLEDVTDASSGETDEMSFQLGRPLISYENRERIWSLGPAAIQPLTQRAWGDARYDWAIAERLLVDLGGRALIEPMSRIVLTHPVTRFRLGAMEALLYAGGFFEIWDLLEERMEVEKDPAVRARAIAYRNACLEAGRASPSDVSTP